MKGCALAGAVVAEQANAGFAGFVRSGLLLCHVETKHLLIAILATSSLRAIARQSSASRTALQLATLHAGHKSGMLVAAAAERPAFILIDPAHHRI
ncbi:hypothetical protein [Mucilaginibacter gilvus]|uniref:Uncharacterized protein n=1 Tax=Mucilaginibacter gilvus TaxID=2305909 RepID=A0A3S3ZAP2_9SPHI|nr:hypothetical protein [Mucilaginibacter gilvus]RWY57208.1 hypothetical protein EPL05_01350 [Mucilaginibacter gilvus]